MHLHDCLAGQSKSPATPTPTPWGFYPGQLDYVARVAMKDFGLLAADTGCGKSLMALALLRLKMSDELKVTSDKPADSDCSSPIAYPSSFSCRRALILAPQGTVNGAPDTLSQWEAECAQFWPEAPVHRLFTWEQYVTVVNRYGQLPAGLYLSYYEAFLRPRAAYGPHAQPQCLAIRLVADHQSRSPGKPLWDAIALDEAHCLTHLSAQITRNFVRLEARCRYAITATPLPNAVPDLFPLLGWLAVPHWHEGRHRNTIFPFAQGDLSRFSAKFCAVERDLTQERLNQAANHRRRGRCQKRSPVLSNSMRLQRLLRPIVAYLSKEECNPDLVPCRTFTVRLPMSDMQQRLYTWAQDARNVPGNHSGIRAARQMTWLRNICAEPHAQSLALARYGAPVVSAQLTPKTRVALDLVYRCLQRGEQVLLVAARVRQTDELYFRLASHGLKPLLARIDSSVPAALHADQAERFRRGSARVMFMGVKCAKAYSFSQCPNVILLSLEYAYGSLHQARGRIWRVNSVGSQWPSDSRPCVRIWCLLYEQSIEELIYQRLAAKQSAAQLCVRGEIPDAPRAATYFSSDR